MTRTDKAEPLAKFISHYSAKQRLASSIYDIIKESIPGMPTAIYDQDQYISNITYSLHNPELFNKSNVLVPLEGVFQSVNREYCSQVNTLLWNNIQKTLDNNLVRSIIKHIEEKRASKEFSEYKSKESFIETEPLFMLQDNIDASINKTFEQLDKYELIRPDPTSKDSLNAIAYIFLGFLAVLGVGAISIFIYKTFISSDELITDTDNKLKKKK